jgi:protein-disulfide isomerase
VSDFGCPHCKTFHDETAEELKAQYVDTGSVRWVALPYSLGPTTLAAAASALCAQEQGSYFEYTNTLFTIEPSETRLLMPGFQQAAEAVGLDVDEFTSCVNSERYVDTINENNLAATRAGVSGTPTFFLNDQELSGAQPLAAFAQVIQGLLAEQ